MSWLLRGKERTSLLQDTLYEPSGILLEYSSHLLAKGNLTDLKATVEGSTSLILSDEDQREFSLFLDRVLSPRAALTNLEAVRRKELSKSPGKPWKTFYPCYGDILRRLSESLEHAYSLMAAALQLYEEAVVRGDITTGWFTAQMKQDRYSSQKLTKRKFRSIQCPEMFFNLLMVKYCEPVDEVFKFTSPHILAYRDHDQMTKLRDFSSSSFGIDFTACDKNVAGFYSAEYARHCALLSGASPAVCKFIFDNLMSPLVWFPDDTYCRLFGSNMSGTIITTGTNCAYHIFVEERLQSHFPHKHLCLSDDGLINANSIHPHLKLLYAIYGQAVVKIDTHNESFYPSIPPFLGFNWLSVETTEGRGLVMVPTDLLRAVSTLQFDQEDGVELFRQRVKGISETMVGFLLLQEAGIPIPMLVQQVFLLAERCGVFPSTTKHTALFLA